MNISVFQRRNVTIFLVILALVLILLPVISIITGAHAAGNKTNAGPYILNFKGNHLRFVQSSVQPPPTDKQCRTQIGVPCYSPQEIHQAYNLNPVLNAGYTGKGKQS